MLTRRQKLSAFLEGFFSAFVIFPRPQPFDPINGVRQLLANAGIDPNRKPSPGFVLQSRQVTRAARLATYRKVILDEQLTPQLRSVLEQNAKTFSGTPDIEVMLPGSLAIKG